MPLALFMKLAITDGTFPGSDEEHDLLSPVADVPPNTTEITAPQGEALPVLVKGVVL